THPPLLSRALCFSVADRPRVLHSFPTRRSSDLRRLPLLPLGLQPQPGEIVPDPLDEAFLAPLGVGIVDPQQEAPAPLARQHPIVDRKSTRLNSSHVKISYAVFCLKKKKNTLRLR